MRFHFLIFALLFSLPIQGFASGNPCDSKHCIAVVDAGSTGSRVHLYVYDLNDTQSAIQIQELWNKKINPGFASLEPSASSINPYLQSLLSKAPYENIPLYFYATGGMRLLPAAKQKKYYEVLKSWFSQQSNWKLMDAKTISGNDEALFDWLSINYLKGTLQNSTSPKLGIMDMGGASVQIAFPIQDNQDLDPKSQIKFQLYGQKFNLYVHSFLGLGQTEILHQFLDSPNCFANNYPLPNGLPAEGNAGLCEQELSKMMTEIHKVNAIQSLLALNPVDSWYAIGGLTYMLNSSLFHFEKEQFTNQNLLEQADNNICHQQWEQLEAQFPNDEYTYQYCLFSAYYYALMIDGYGFSPQENIHFIPSNQNQDWTLGVVLYH